MSELSRRAFLGSLATGVGAAALSDLLAGLPGAAPSAAPPWAPRARRVIHLCMAGGPSQLETFDEKPELARLDGQPMPESFTRGMPIAQLQGHPLTCMGPRATFASHGQSGQRISSFLPHIAGVADRIAIVRSMVTEQINHDPAHTFFNTGSILPGRPSMGAWVNYGLGAMDQDLPSFVVLTSTGGRNPQPIAARQWSNGFLPGRFQGVEFHAKGDPVHHVERPPGVSGPTQSRVVEAVTALDGIRGGTTGDPRVEARIAQYELAFRMQASVPELMDLSDESPETLELYGAEPGDGSFASNCLLARRLAERGVRFIQLYHRGWDHHSEVRKFMGVCSGLTDRPTAALIRDLERRGMLDDTLIIWGGEFGRTPMSQGGGQDPGRDHHIQGYSMFLAGGGVRGGITHGATDELGYAAVEDVVHLRDLHATMLHLLGLDHERLSVRHQGLDVRLTGVEEARVVRALLS